MEVSGWSIVEDELFASVAARVHIRVIVLHRWEDVL